MDFAVICIGNRDGGDDAVGPYIADKLNERHVDFEVIDCGIIPENYTSVIKKIGPETLVIVDAVEMGLNAGDIRIVPRDKIGVMHISTHGIPVSVLMDYLEKYVEKIVFIGIQPREMSGNLSDAVKESADQLIEIIKEKKFDNLKKL